MSKSNVFPTEEEARKLLLTPDTLAWNTLGDARVFLAAGYALLLQVAHPTVGSGVRDHSTFLEDPWNRLFRTVDYLAILAWGGKDAIAMGHRLRDLHKPIKGTNPDGSRYHALEPDAYAWVHATLIEGAVAARTRFVGPLKPAEVDRLYAEYMPLGRLVGVREGDLPDNWTEFCDYFRTTANEELSSNETVDSVLGALQSPASPALNLPGFERLWPLLRIGPREAMQIATVGLMTPAIRARLALPWTARQQLELRALGKASRAIGPVMPKTLKNIGPPYLKQRRAAIARGPLGGGRPAAAPVAIAEPAAVAAG